VVSVALGGDSVWNGVAIGVAAGLGLGAASIVGANGYEAEMFAIATLPILAGIGAGVGFAIDWSIGRPQTVWSASPRAGGAKARVAPILRRDAKAVALRLCF